MTAGTIRHLVGVSRKDTGALVNEVMTDAAATAQEKGLKYFFLEGLLSRRETVSASSSAGASTSAGACAGARAGVRARARETSRSNEDSSDKKKRNIRIFH
jgi:hypothetical protein